MIKIKSPNNLKTFANKNVQKKFFIYIDMDGVTDNWIESACKVCDVDINNKEIYSKMKEGVSLEDIGMMTSKKMWDKIGEAGIDFWTNLALFPWTKKLITEMEKLGEVYVLTSPGTCVWAPTGKMIWIKKFFPQLIKKLIICKNKERLASKNSILIDDTEDKIDAFRKEGGHAFLWPNQLKLIDGDINVDETIDRLIKEVKGYISGQD